MSQPQNHQSNGQYPVNQDTTIIGKRYQMMREIATYSNNSLKNKHNWISYIAQDTGIIGNPWCVVKEISLATLSLQQKKRWDELVTIQQRLGEHNDIPRILAYFTEKSALYVIREYLEGETLKTQLENKLFNQTEAIKLLVNLLDLISFIHSNDLIHGDIHPDNIIELKQNHKYALLDFDRLQPTTVDEDHLNERNIVTLVFKANSFFAPEQSGGQAITSSDFYSLGKTIIYSLTKSLSPHWESENQEIVAKLSPQLKRILNRMIAPNVKARYHSVEEIEEDLLQIAEASTIMNSEPTGIDYEAATATSINQDYESQTVETNTRFNKQLSLLPVLLGVVSLSVLIGIGELVNPMIRPFFLSWQGKQALTEEPQEALDKFQQAIDINNKYTGGWIGRGDALFALERYRAALLAYDKAVALNSENANAWKGRGDALFRLERFEAALTAYNKSLQIQPNNPEGFNRKGRALYKLERQEEALQAQEKALEIKPNFAQALSDRGIVLIGLGEYENALKSFEDAQAIEPLNPTFWQNKALAWQYLGRNQEAFRLYQEALESYNNKLQQDPDNVIAWIDKGNVLTKLQQHSEAVKAYDKAIAVNHNSHLAWLNKGNSFFAMGKYEDALASFDRALKIAPESYLTWHNRGSLLRDGIADYQEAIASYEKATQLNPSFYHAWRDMGLTQSQSGQQYLALKSFQTALQINPEDYQSWVGRGIAYSFLNKISESVAAFNRAAKINPNDPSIWMNKGYALEEAGKYSEACDAYEKVLEINPTLSPAIESMDKLGCQR